ncbi:hypothetical protein G7070_06225 [Propioniciclava coleopterorum]|uniref:Uncharacterized protein n=1 Tax=Propioniciclava coleopterorum TaxID=2714937 RepID=A0A6G7Y5P2_9ACTN|nr:hypothetical protein [Propioniciclava coleopterorum]QIK71937.1 hypothetical protein G7070_06225 [Propioniciclava coleopterorum]
MSELLDTLVWLVNFPVSHGYAMVFIAGFSLLGLLMMARGAREPVDAASTPARRRRAAAAGVQRLVYRVLAVVVLGGGVVGLLSMLGLPVTHAYIHANGTPVPGQIEGDYVVFTTTEGVRHVQPMDFFSTPLYPDTDVWIPLDSPVTVRYLAAHPQAYVVDTTTLPER